MPEKINVALVDLEFGSTFTKIYLRHPDVEPLTICHANPQRLAQHQEKFGVVKAVATLEEVFADATIDATHLNSGIPDHTRQAIANLEAGKHVACTIPMATSLDDIRHHRLERDEPLAMEITRALFHSARGYEESFTIYGEDATFEAPQLEGEAPVLFRLSAPGAHSGPRRSTFERLYVPDYGNRLPEEIRSFTGAVEIDGRGEHPSVMHCGGHGGSHPHTVHEFMRSIIEERTPSCDEIAGANWTAPGICAHGSSMSDGKEVTILSFN